MHLYTYVYRRERVSAARARQKDDGMHADNCTFAVLRCMIGMLLSIAAGDSKCIHLLLWLACDSTGVSLVDSFDARCVIITSTWLITAFRCTRSLRRSLLYMCIDASARAVSLNSQIVQNACTSLRSWSNDIETSCCGIVVVSGPVICTRLGIKLLTFIGLLLRGVRLAAAAKCRGEFVEMHSFILCLSDAVMMSIQLQFGHSLCVCVIIIFIK
jgi:hypothetical protein